MKLSQVKEILKAELITGEDKLDLAVKAGAGSDLMSDLLRGPRKEGVLVLTGLNTMQVVRTAVIAGVAAVVIVRAKRPDQDMMDLARQHGLPLLSTPFTMYTACGRLFREGLSGVEQKASKQ